MLRLLAVLCALLLQALDARAEQPPFEDRVGDIYEIRLESVSKTSGTATSGSSNSAMTLVERVIALHESGVELEFDLPEGTSAEDRARNWQFPARVLKSSDQPLQLLNEAELKARVQDWLKRGGMTEAACGHWIFTWTAIKIECDPQSVLRALEPFDLRPSDLRDGAQNRDSGGTTFVAEMEVDPERVRRERAEMDVAVAEMMRDAPLAIEAALQARAAERISGTITTTFETDPAGRVTRRMQVTNIEIAGGDGSLERQTGTVIVERRLAGTRP